MVFPERFSNLPDYAFPRLRKLLDHHPAGGEPIAMTIGEPKHAMPDFVGAVLAENLGGFGVYPPNDGTPELLSAISGWIKRRYGVDCGPERLMVANGSREALFNAALALSPESKNGQRPAILMPNPFYQVYTVAASAVGAEPIYLPAGAATGFLPDFHALAPELLDRTTVAYICSPANPQGAVASREYLIDLLALAEKHDFIVFADECYSEIWNLAPPPGILAIAAEVGADPERVVAFNSLSKRSNMPGLRSGFVAGGPKSIHAIRQLRAFAGAPLPLPLQKVAEACWKDDAHVAASLKLYQDKYRLAAEIFSGLQNFRLPEGGMFLWLPVGDGEAAALKLWTETGVRVLPGGYLSRDSAQGNPGRDYIRVALVAPYEQTSRGLTLLRDCLYD